MLLEDYLCYKVTNDPSYMIVCCRYDMMLVERCYDNIRIISTDGSDVVGEFADVVVDMSTGILLRDISVLNDTSQSMSLALSVSALAMKFTHCCVIITPINCSTRSVVVGLGLGLGL